MLAGMFKKMETAVSDEPPICEGCANTQSFHKIFVWNRPPVHLCLECARDHLEKEKHFVCNQRKEFNDSLTLGRKVLLFFYRFFRRLKEAFAGWGII